MPTIDVIPDDIIDLDKGYYHSVYAVLHFKKGGGVDSKEYQGHGTRSI